MLTPQTSMIHEWRLHRPHEGQRELRRLLALPDAKVITAVLGRRWGKTTGTIEALVEIAIRHRVQIGWFAHVSRAMKVAWEHAVRVIPHSAILKRSDSDRSIILLNGSRFQFNSLDEPENVLGWGFDIIVIDEGASCSRKARDEILAPMAADRNGVILIITTPKGKKGRGGWVWRDYQKAQSNTPGYYWMHGASTQNPLPAIQEWVAWAKDNLPAAVYEQEVEGKFLDHGGGILDFSGVATMGGTEDRPVKLPWYEADDHSCALDSGRKVTREQCTTGIDFAETTNYTVVASIGFDSKRLKYLDRFHKIGWPAQVARIKKGVEKMRGPVRIDATGIGGPVKSMLRQAHIPFRPVMFTNDMKTSLVQGLQVAVERKEFAMPWIAEAIAEAESFQGDVLSSGRMKYGAADGFHDDIVIALSLAVQGLQNRITGVPT